MIIYILSRKKTRASRTWRTVGARVASAKSRPLSISSVISATASPLDLLIFSSITDASPANYTHTKGSIMTSRLIEIRYLWMRRKKGGEEEEEEEVQMVVLEESRA